MSADKPVRVIQTKRSPPIWAIKVGARYATGFMGGDAKARAVAYASTNFPSFEIVEKPPLKRATRERREVVEMAD